MFNSILAFLRVSYIRTICIFFIIILIVNLFLIGFGHFDAEPEEGQEKFKRDAGNTITDGLYFTTTQISTIGYGDITPKTAFAKIISGFFHVLVLAINLKLISELGIMPRYDKSLTRMGCDAFSVSSPQSSPLYPSIIPGEQSKATGINRFRNVGRRVAATGDPTSPTY